MVFGRIIFVVSVLGGWCYGAEDPAAQRRRVEDAPADGLANLQSALLCLRDARPRDPDRASKIILDTVDLISPMIPLLRPRMMGQIVVPEGELRAARAEITGLIGILEQIKRQNAQADIGNVHGLNRLINAMRVLIAPPQRAVRTVRPPLLFVSPQSPNKATDRLM